MAKVRGGDKVFGRCGEREPMLKCFSNSLCFQYPFLDALGECSVNDSKAGESSKNRKYL